MTNLLDNKTVPLYGEGKNRRDWIYVEDTCRAVLTVLEKGSAGEIYNVGSDNEKTNLELTKTLLKLMGKDESMIRRVPDRPGHDQRYAIDSAKIRRELGWQAEVGFEAGLRRTIDWYLSNPDWVDLVSSGSYGEWIKKNYAWRAEKESK